MKLQLEGMQVLGDIGLGTKKTNFKEHGQFYTIYFAVSMPYLEEENVASVRAGLSHLSSHEGSSLFLIL